MEYQAEDQQALYSPLDLELKQIRILTLLPGSSEDPIKGFLGTMSLDDNPEYEALSYVWGDPKITHLICVDGADYAVTTNLETALRYIRLKDCPRKMWIDAICINQSDISERNHQVKKMRLIYRTVSTVLA
jgi:hypothetical protein